MADEHGSSEGTAGTASPPRRRGWRRALALLVLGLAALVVLAVLAVWLGLRSATVRQSLLARVVAILERDYGLALRAADFDLRPLAGVLVLDELAVGAPGGPPLATAERATLAVDPWSLRRPTLIVRSLELEAPGLDLSAPFPVLPAEEEPPGAEPGFEIRRLAVSRGSVAGIDVPEAARAWLSSAAVDGLDANGSFAGGRWTVELTAGRARVERPDGLPALDLLLEAAGIAYQEGEPLAVSELRAVGEGVSLVASGTVGLGEREPSDLRFMAEVSAEHLAAGVPPGGVLTAEGEIALPAVAGRVRLASRNLPAEAARPWLDPELFADLALGGTRLDAGADLALDGAERISGTAEVTWRRGERPLARAAAEIAEGGETGAPGAPISLAVEADLLPGSPGRRRVEARLAAGSLAEMASGTIQAARVEVRAPDLAAAWVELHMLWPALVPVHPADAPLAGTLAADVSASGPVGSPRGALAATFSPRAGGELRLAARGRPLDLAGSAEVTATALPLALLGDLALGAAGSLSGRLRLDGDARGLATDLAARIEGAAVPPTLAAITAVEEAAFTATGRLAIEPAPRFTGRATVGAAGLAATLEGLGEARAARLDLDADGTLDLAPFTFRGHVEALAEEVAGPEGSAAARIALTGDGVFAAEPAGWTGPVAVEASGLALPGGGALGTARLTGDGALAFSPPSWDGTLALDASGLAVPEAIAAEGIRLDVVGRFAADPAASTGRARFTVERAEVAALGPERPVTGVALSIESDGAELRISELAADVADPAGGWPGRLAGTGRATLRPLLVSADLDLVVERPVAAVESATARLTLRNGTLSFDLPEAMTAAGPVRLDAVVPVGALRAIPALAEAVAGLPFTPAEGPVRLSLDAPALDSSSLLPALGLPPRDERVRGGVAADLEVDLGAPALATGEVRLSGLVAETSDGRLEAPEDLVLALGGGEVALAPARLVATAAGLPPSSFELSAGASLARGFRLADPPAGLVERLSAAGSGRLDASLLGPFLAGGRGRGALDLAFSAEGPLDGLAAELSARGPSADLSWSSPYPVRVEAPDLAATFADGRLTIERGRLRVNGGTVELAGGRAADGTVGVETRLEDVRSRLDYGLAATWSGLLALTGGGRRASREDGAQPSEADPGGPATAAGYLLSGRLTLERGVLDRDVDLDREVLAVLFGPDDEPGTEEDPLEAVALDLEVDTAGGVRVRNNVGDLRAAWDVLEITGTLAVPVVRGRIDLDPGGLVYAYGQTVRIDRGALVFTGDPETDPQVELSATSSLEDPTLAGRGGPAAPLDALAASGATAAGTHDLADVLATGVAGYYGERLASRLGESLGLTRVSLRPVLIAAETDPSARLTIGRDLSPNVSFALSFDLRNAERRTYLVDLHRFRALPTLTAQGFTDDEGDGGGSLQQTLELGASRGTEERAPLVRKVRLRGTQGTEATVTAIAGRARRAARRAARDLRGRPAGEHAAFDAEVELADALRRAGYPDPLVQVEVEPVEDRRGRVDLLATVEPGPRVEVRFEGDRPSRVARREIAALYRHDFSEAESLVEMESATERALRAAGHPAPRVEVEAVDRVAPAARDSVARRVVVRAEAGPRLEVAEIAFPDLDPESARLVASRFAGTLARTELAAGLPAADRRLRLLLAALGWPAAEVTGRDVDAEAKRLTVRLAPGTRRTVAAVEITGVEPAEATELAAVVPLAAGNPARADRLAAGAREIERALARRGLPDARATAELVPSTEGLDRVVARYAVQRGEPVSIASVELPGRRSTAPALLERLVDLEPGAPLVEAEVAAARGRLLDTGVFSRVVTEIERGEDGAAAVSFALSEAPRYRLGWGVRLESGLEPAAVVDAVDTNFLGRAITLGVRGLYEKDDESGRLFLRTGGLFGSLVSLESFAEVRRRLTAEGFFVEDRSTLSLQLARPFGRLWEGRVYARYSDSEQREVEPDPFFPEGIFNTRTRHPYLGVQLVREGRDDPVEPTRGTFWSLDLSGSGPWLGSDLGYVRLFTQASTVRPLGRVAGLPLAWAQSARVGVGRPSSGQALVLDARFFAGGAFSVRGYPTEELGPFESLGSVVRPRGGEALLVVNQELRVGLPWDLTALVFADAGQVWDTLDDVEADLATAVGLGLRARTPVGLVRFDAALPLDRRPGDDRYELYLGFGNAF